MSRAKRRASVQTEESKNAMIFLPAPQSDHWIAAVAWIGAAAFAVGLVVRDWWESRK